MLELKRAQYRCYESTFVIYSEGPEKVFIMYAVPYVVTYAHLQYVMNSKVLYYMYTALLSWLAVLCILHCYMVQKNSCAIKAYTHIYMYMRECVYIQLCIIQHTHGVCRCKYVHTRKTNWNSPSSSLQLPTFPQSSHTYSYAYRASCSFSLGIREQYSMYCIWREKFSFIHFCVDSLVVVWWCACVRVWAAWREKRQLACLLACLLAFHAFFFLFSFNPLRPQEEKRKRERPTTTFSPSLHFILLTDLPGFLFSFFHSQCCSFRNESARPDLALELEGKKVPPFWKNSFYYESFLTTARRQELLLPYVPTYIIKHRNRIHAAGCRSALNMLHSGLNWMKGEFLEALMKWNGMYGWMYSYSKQYKRGSGITLLFWMNRQYVQCVSLVQCTIQYNTAL